MLTMSCLFLFLLVDIGVAQAKSLSDTNPTGSGGYPSSLIPPFPIIPQQEEQ
ncbi:hypothetical protein PAMP_013288 [Pampus punctatissimus]